MTNREFLSTIVNGTISDEVIAFAQNRLEALDNGNARRAEKTAEKRNKENAPLISAIKEFLADHPKTLSVDLAVAMTEIFGEVISTSKITGVCGVLRKDGVLTSEDIAVKGKGKQKGWSLAVDLEDEEESLVFLSRTYVLEGRARPGAIFGENDEKEFSNKT